MVSHCPDTQNSFQLISHSSFVDGSGARHVVGEARNIAGVTKNLRAAVWIRGQGMFEELIMAAEWDWVSGVAPGQTVPFEVIFSKSFGGYYDHYEIVLEGWSS